MCLWGKLPPISGILYYMSWFNPVEWEILRKYKEQNSMLGIQSPISRRQRVQVFGRLPKAEWTMCSSFKHSWKQRQKLIMGIIIYFYKYTSSFFLFSERCMPTLNKFDEIICLAILKTKNLWYFGNCVLDFMFFNTTTNHIERAGN